MLCLLFQRTSKLFSMKKSKGVRKAAFFSLLFLLLAVQVTACSMCKITSHGKTMVGNNEDTWRIGSKIWFEPGRNNEFGAAYVGDNDLFPEGGMNEAGLVYDGFSVYPRHLKPLPGRIPIIYPAEFLKRIMQTCSSIEEVYDFANHYDRSIFNNGMLLFVDKSGKYLVMEVDTMIIGTNEKYILTNFCPSQINANNVRTPRYVKAKRFLQNNLPDSSLGFCRSVMDTMHECRDKMGDGTTYTSIYDLNQGQIYLYFYHDFKHTVTLNLQEELAKGYHLFKMPELFPVNPEYISLAKHKTPFNYIPLRIALVCTFIFYILSTLFFIFRFINLRFITKNVLYRIKEQYFNLFFIFLNPILALYSYILLTTIPIYYFDSPYRFDNNNSLNIISYTPLTLLIALGPLTLIFVQLLKQSKIIRFPIVLSSLNFLTYILMLILFIYWKLF